METRMTDFKLYYAETLNPRKVCAIARHLNSPVEFVHVNLGKGEHKTPQFAAMNPNQKVPVLDIGSRTIWESNAIMCFLSRFAGSEMWPEDERQVDVMRWLHWDALHFFPPQARSIFSTSSSRCSDWARRTPPRSMSRRRASANMAPC